MTIGEMTITTIASTRDGVTRPGGLVDGGAASRFVFGEFRTIEFGGVQTAGRGACRPALGVREQRRVTAFPSGPRERTRAGRAR